MKATPSSDVRHALGRETGLKQGQAARTGRAWLDNMYRSIRDRICLLTYPPGTILREADFAEEFGVSRTPVRQVLQRLEFEGLVEAKNGVGTIVTGVDLRTFEDAYEMRLRLAELIGEMSPSQPTLEDIECIVELQRQSQELTHTKKVEEYWRITHDLHLLVRRMIGNSALCAMYDLFYYQTSRIWFGFVQEHWDEELEALHGELTEMLRVLRAGDMRGMGFVQRNYISMRLNRIIGSPNGD